MLRAPAALPAEPAKRVRGASPKRTSHLSPELAEPQHAQRMNQELAVRPGSLLAQPSTMGQSPLVDVLEASATKGEWIVPPIKEASLALAVSDFSASWRGLRGIRSQTFSPGMVAICPRDQSRNFEMRKAAQVAVIRLRDEALDQILHQTRYLPAELQVREGIQDVTLRRLIEVLLREKHEGFQSGSLFLDGIATALAGYLLSHYSISPPVIRNSVGGMAPSSLRRCIELMDARLEGNLRLSELANEAGISGSHFIRSFRQSTGKTPYQFLLHRRIARAQTLMRDHRVSLTEVALASGFADQHHLARVFRGMTGMTPSSYRRSL